MLVVHGGDENGVDVFAIEDGAIVAAGGNAGIFYRFLRGGMAAVVEIADGDALNAGNFEGSLEVFASANAGADGGEANGVAGGDGTRPRGEHMRLQDIFGDGGGGDGAAAEVNELTTREGMFRHEIFRPHKCVEISAETVSPVRRYTERNYCTGAGWLVKRFSRECGEVAVRSPSHSSE